MFQQRIHGSLDGKTEAQRVRLLIEDWKCKGFTVKSSREMNPRTHLREVVLTIDKPIAH